MLRGINSAQRHLPYVWEKQLGSQCLQIPCQLPPRSNSGQPDDLWDLPTSKHWHARGVLTASKPTRQQAPSCQSAGHVQASSRTTAWQAPLWTCHADHMALASLSMLRHPPAQHPGACNSWSRHGSAPTAHYLSPRTPQHPHAPSSTAPWSMQQLQQLTPLTHFLKQPLAGARMAAAQPHSTGSKPPHASARPCTTQPSTLEYG